MEDCMQQPVRKSVQLNGVRLAAPGLVAPVERAPDAAAATGPPHWSAGSNPPADFYCFADA